MKKYRKLLSLGLAMMLAVMPAMTAFAETEGVTVQQEVEEPEEEATETENEAPERKEAEPEAGSEEAEEPEAEVPEKEKEEAEGKTSEEEREDSEEASEEIKEESEEEVPAEGKEESEEEAPEEKEEETEETSEEEKKDAGEKPVPENIVLTAELDDVTVTLKADADAFDNKGELSLTVTPAEITGSEEEALEAAEKENVAKRVTYDITVLDDGEEIEPVKTVKVFFELKDAPSGADGVNIYHHETADSVEQIFTENFKEDAAEETDAAEEDEDDVTAEAETDSFSLYTVDFTYKDKTISIAGDSTGNKLDDIVDQLGIEEKVEEATTYQDAECTEEVENGEVKEDGKTLFTVYEDGGEWYVDAVNAFDTEHGLVVKTADGAEYKIKVTDDTTYKVTFNVRGGVGGVLSDFAAIGRLSGMDWEYDYNVEAYVKNFNAGTVYSAIIAEWEGCIPGATNYVFDKWTPETGTLTKDTTFTANYKASYKVTFDVQGHGTAPSSQAIASGGKVTEPTPPTATGYIFDGWFKESGCTNAWTFDTDMVIANTTLYAKWTAKTAPQVSDLTVTPPSSCIYDGNGKTASFTTKSGITGMGTITVQYRVGEAGEWSSTSPVNAGEYYVKAVIAEGSSYASAELTSENWKFTISPKQLTVTGSAADGKTYDGTTTAVAHVGTVSGKVDSDDVTVTIDSATFADKNAGTGKDVTIKYSLTGTEAGNYAAPDDSTTVADIEKKGLVVTGTTADKAYDGNTTVTVTKGTVTDIVEGDDVTVKASTTDTFGSKDAGTTKTVTVTYTLSGGDINNYTKPTDETVTATITAKAVNVTADNKSSKVGEDIVALTYTADDLISGDSFTGKLATNADKTKVGTYDIIQGTLTAGNNYSINFTKGTYTVTASEPSEEPRPSFTGTQNNGTAGTAENPVTDGQWNCGPGGQWTFRTNGQFKDTWGYIKLDNGKVGWFWFDKNGVMATGWQQVNGKWYYFNQNHDGSYGMMLTDTTTPDGYRVGPDGVWIR